MAIEYLRPTADADLNVDLNSAMGPDNSIGLFHATSSSMSGVYNGKSGAGPTGGANALVVPISYYSERVFTTWQSSSNSYTSLTINISLSTNITNLQDAMYYSTNGGSSWTSFGTATGSQKTYTATITGTSLSSIQVAVGVFSVSGTKTTNVYDIWTAGTYTPSVSSPNYAVDDYGQMISFGRWR